MALVCLKSRLIMDDNVTASTVFCTFCGRTIFFKREIKILSKIKNFYIQPFTIRYVIECTIIFSKRVTLNNHGRSICIRSRMDHFALNSGYLGYFLFIRILQLRKYRQTGLRQNLVLTG